MEKMTAKEAAALAVKALDSKMGVDIQLIEITDVSTLADYFLICTASSSTHVKTLCDAVEEAMDNAGEPMLSREGHRSGTWVLMDFGCVVVHVFTQETRAFYNLERLWQDGKQVNLSGILENDACWTAMVLDFLPYKQPQKPRKEKLSVLRYVMFALSLALVSGLFLMKVANLEQIMVWLFLAGNAFYYIAGVALAFIFKDNRAFCKYLCPITVFLKPMSYFSLLRVHCDESKCVHCGKCLRVCPMDVEVNKESRKRKNGTECILCYECTKACPTKALH